MHLLLARRKRRHITRGNCDDEFYGVCLFLFFIFHFLFSFQFFTSLSFFVISQPVLGACILSDLVTRSVYHRFPNAQTTVRCFVLF
jgi:hypothetical protein